MIDYEKLGAFYLGAEYDLAAGRATDNLVLYDAKDLTTHAVIVGMTGSGKTGLGVALLEEAAIDRIPALIIDPKGDLGNLLLRFPQLRPADFAPWVDMGDAARQGQTREEFAASRAELWRSGLAEWRQTPDRIQRYCDAAEVAIYTPGSDAGLPLTVLRSLNAPSAEVLDNADDLRERITATASGLCALLGLDTDPLRSREHILFSNILDQAWRAGRSLDMAELTYEIQSPGFRKIGLLDIDQIFPPADRLALATRLNSVVASPGFARWMEGEPLDIRRLLYGADGKSPRLCVLSIAHLNEQERMFFVTLLLNEVISWMRAQPGTSSLRAILYMDELFGYLPPTANPPSKQPLLTLLKQARAYGLGLVLATQNPVDLDYKALSNAGTWFLGRLQTERDKLRVLDGLEGASSMAGALFDRAAMDKILSGLRQRVFLLSNAHDDHPIVFQTRWALSYLAGPMTREQIRTLMRDRVAATATRGGGLAASLANAPSITAAGVSNSTRRPLLPDTIEQRFVPVSRSVPRDAAIEYRPALVGAAKLHYVDSKSSVDVWRNVQRVCRIEDEVPASPWEAADTLDAHPLTLETAPIADAAWAELPAGLARVSNFSGWKTKLKEALYRDCRLTLWRCAAVDQFSAPGASEGEFRTALQQSARERRDREIEKLREKYRSKLLRQDDAIRTAERRRDTEAEQANAARTSAWVTTLTSVLGAFMGRKTISATNIGRAGSAARAHSRAAQQQADIERAAGRIEVETEKKAQLESELQAELDSLSRQYDPDALTLEPVELTPRKSDITVGLVGLLWLPWQRESDGTLSPAWDQQATA